MTPFYDLILPCKEIETVQVADATQVLRSGRKRYFHSIRGVVRRDGPAVEPSKRR